MITEPLNNLLNQVFLYAPKFLGVGLLSPDRNMADRLLLGYLPNLLAGGLILLVGWFVPRIVQRIVVNLLAAAGADRLSERVGIASALGAHRLRGLLGNVAYTLILIPVLIAALSALQLDAVTAPASQMLNTVLGALPSIFAACVIVLFSYVIGRIVAGAVANLLAGMGFDRLPSRLGLTRGDSQLGQTPSEIAGKIVLVGILLLAVVEAGNLLAFAAVSTLVSQFMIFAGKVLFGLVILGVGLFLANLAADAVRRSDQPRS